MKPTRNPLLLALALVLGTSGCATVGSSLDVTTKTIRETEKAKAGPDAAPQRSITGFSSALRCMDNMLIDYGVRDVSMLVEEIVDQTKKINAGTRDMLITAVSDMTRRSRAVRLIAFGKDATNAVSFLQSAQRLNAYQVIPAYDIKGSVTQLDENVIRNQKDLGVSYSMNLNKSEGQTQALRGLVELAVIELAGKLTKIPYWTCLGGDPKTSEEVRLEMSDWYYAMAANPVEIVAYFQNQLRRRGFYRGPIDGKFNVAVDSALAGYRQALEMSKEAVIDEAFFKTFLNADHSQIKAPAQPAVYPLVADRAVPAASAATAQPADIKGLVLAVGTEPNRMRFAVGEQIKLLVRANRDAYVYCYIQDETSRITRFYPNRFAQDSLLAAGARSRCRARCASRSS